MSTTVSTSITAVVQNEITEEEIENVLDGKNHDSIEEYAEHLEGELEAVLQSHVFGKADEIVVMDVNTVVEDDS